MQAQLQLQVPVEHIGSVYAALERHAAQRVQEDYGSDGTLSLTVSVTEGSVDTLVTLVRDCTSGRVTAYPVTI